LTGRQSEDIERFVDREDELNRLRDCYASDDADMVVIFGRHRLGKTELVQESLECLDDTVLYQATETTRQIQLDAFVDVAAESFPGIDRIEGKWESLLGYLAE
jgi:AAA+ ATPase superfamily predicted ATPase